MANPDDKINAALAAVITGAYKEAGLTLPQLAERAKLSSTTVQRIAAGSVSIKVGDLVAIAGAVGIPSDELFERALRHLERDGMSVPSATPASLDTKRKQREAAMMSGGALEAEKHAAISDEELDSTEPEAP